MKIGIQGGKGSFNEEALAEIAKTHNITTYETIYSLSTREVLRALTAAEIDRGVFAIYNSKSLMVTETLAELGHWSYDVIAYSTIPVRHMLMTLSDVTRDEVAGIIGHAEAIVQCKEMLQSHFPTWHAQPGTGDMLDGAAAAAFLSAGDARIPRTTAVLGSRAIADAYGLQVIAENLQDDPHNTTTFLLVRKRSV